MILNATQILNGVTQTGNRGKKGVLIIKKEIHFENEDKYLISDSFFHLIECLEYSLKFYDVLKLAKSQDLVVMKVLEVIMVKFENF